MHAMRIYAAGNRHAEGRRNRQTRAPFNVEAYACALSPANLHAHALSDFFGPYNLLKTTKRQNCLNRVGLLVFLTQSRQTLRQTPQRQPGQLSDSCWCPGFSPTMSSYTSLTPHRQPGHLSESHWLACCSHTSLFESRWFAGFSAPSRRGLHRTPHRQPGQLSESYCFADCSHTNRVDSGSFPNKAV